MMEVDVISGHDRILCIIGGGPSAAKTLPFRVGEVVTINAGHDWLINQNIVPFACGLLDPHQRIADMFTPRNDVFYYVANTVHIDVLEKLQGFKVIFWYPKPVPSKLQIGGGSSMGVRWLNLGYVLGYRTFHIHGLDSSFSTHHTHVYPDRRDEDDKEDIWVDGYRTRPNFLAQCIDFFETMDEWKKRGIDVTKVYVHGEGLLPHRWRTGNSQFDYRLHEIADKVRRRLHPR